MVFVAEAKEQNVSERSVCLILGIAAKTLQNWRKFGLQDKRKNSPRYVPHRLSISEEDTLYQEATSERFRDLTPEQIVAILAYENRYIASESTLYRLLRKRKALVHRQESKKPCASRLHVPLVLNASNQVWAWDITWLPGDVRGHFKYAYSIIDLFDRTLLGWIVEDYESEEHAVKLFKQVCRDKKVTPVIVHADNGNAMRGSSLGSYLDGLMVSRSFSRPRVSNDNAFIESWHKTLKYTVGYPKVFPTLDFAREWFASFVNWYNNSHLHSGLGYVTPMQRRTGEAEGIYLQRDVGIKAAYDRNPSRWRRGKIKRWTSDSVQFGYRPLSNVA